MTSLTLDLDTSAFILGTDPEQFLKFVQLRKLPGVLSFSEQIQVSIFTLAELLNTSPETLLNWLEDEAFSDLIEDVDDDEYFEGEEARTAYEAILRGKDI
jgi:hypothetical protein